MTDERTFAYGRVMKTLADVGPSKLLPSEQGRLRDAADVLVFASSVDETREALRDTALLGEALVSSGRWLEESVNRLLADLVDCGPKQAVTA